MHWLKQNEKTLQSHITVEVFYNQIDVMSYILMTFNMFNVTRLQALTIILCDFSMHNLSLNFFS